MEFRYIHTAVLKALKEAIYPRMWCFARFGTIRTIQKNVKSTPRGVLLLVKLQASGCNFTKSNTPQWVFFTFFKLCTWY